MGRVAVRPGPRAGHPGRRRPPRVSGRHQGPPISLGASPRPRSRTDEAAAQMSGGPSGGPRWLARPRNAPPGDRRSGRASGHRAERTAERARSPGRAGDRARPSTQGRRAHLSPRPRASRAHADAPLECPPFSPGSSRFLCGRCGDDTDEGRGERMNKREMKDMIKMARKLAKPFRVTDDSFRLKDFDPGDTLEFTSEDKSHAKEALAMGIGLLAELQDMLYAQDRWGVLLIFQAMDAAGKDGAIKHVMSGINPQGVQVYSFKSPSPEDLDHAYLWRCMKCLPERGRVGIFNRSYYEETLVVRVHPEFLAKQRLPPELVTKDIWDERFQDIRAFERYLTRNGIAIRKFFLHVSNKEQRKRFLSRIEEPEKNWKFSANDAAEREYWDDYMKAYEDM